MKNILLIFLLLTMFAPVYSDQADLNKDILLAEKIFQMEKEKHSCILSSKEAEDVAKNYLKLENITIDSLSSTAQMMTNLIIGLRLVVEKKQDSDLVYSKLKLNNYNITKDNWKYYLSNYKSSEKINSLEQWIPNNNNILTKSANKCFKPIIEHWLLEQYILHDFDIQAPEMSKLSTSQKLAVWWSHKLEEYDLSYHDKKVILCFLMQRAPVSIQHTEFWSTFFKKRIEALKKLSIDSKNKTKQGN